MRRLISSDNRTGVYNLIFRVLTIAAKFVLSILIVKELSVADYGVFGIFQTTITLSIYLLGFDFYTYNTREILKVNQKSVADCLMNQLLFHGVIYVIVLPILLGVFFFNVIDIEYLSLFYLILITEHISQEVYRFLIVLKKSVAASFILFVRSGLWIFTLAIYWFIKLEKSSLSVVLVFWFLGALLSILIAIKYLPKISSFSIDYGWIKKGIKVAAPFFVATILYKIMEFSGRYFLDYWSTKAIVGVFTFYASIANTIFVFVQAMVLVVMSPLLIEAAQNNQKELFDNRFRKFKKKTVTFTLIAMLGSMLLIYPFIYFLDNQLLLNNIYIYFFLAFATSIFCISYLPHYKLYVFDKDKALLISAAIGATLNLIFNFVLVPRLGIFGAVISQIIGMTTLLLSKQYFLIKEKL
ncbi:hypothetical protein GCM10011414_05400 [Croceivirga lutea]|nr:hypothetical protein GCM10011414_05400 [Croceivirga lutea]